MRGGAAILCVLLLPSSSTTQRATMRSLVGGGQRGERAATTASRGRGRVRGRGAGGGGAAARGGWCARGGRRGARRPEEEAGARAGRTGQLAAALRGAARRCGVLAPARPENIVFFLTQGVEKNPHRKKATPKSGVNLRESRSK